MSHADLLDEDTAKAARPSPVGGLARADEDLERLYARCATAARRGDCTAVREMVSRIAKTDRAARARVAKDAAVAKCLAPAADASAE